MTNVLRTDQVAPHADLVKVVQHHQQNPWRKPCPQHTQVAFEQFLARYQSQPRPLILDSFCGTGMSTALLAKKHPDKWVVGIDQSAHRLARHPHSVAENCLLLRAEAEPFWQCLTEAEIPLYAHWLLYPNPWPKPKQLQRRFHAHPIFPTLLAISKHIELRSNWKIYLDEFRAGCLKDNRAVSVVREFLPKKAITAFEKKYLDHKQKIYQLLID